MIEKRASCWLPVIAGFIWIGFLADRGSGQEPRPGPGDGLSFGWAEADISPKEPVAICGQYHTRISGRIHDPIKASVLALESRNERGGVDQAVLVSCDLVAIRGNVTKRVREMVKPLAPDLAVEKILISATHTHTAPALTDAKEAEHHPYDFLGMWAYRIPEEGVMSPTRYVDFLVEQIAGAVVKAWKARAPGGVSWALGHAVVGHNRRAVYLDGEARMYGNTDDPSFSHIEGVSEERYAQARRDYEAGKDKTGELESAAYINWRVSRALMARFDYQKEHPAYQAELHLLRLGEVAIATNPFELFIDYGLRIKARSPAQQTIVVQLTADCAAYLPTKRAVTGGGYSARIVDGVVGPEGGKVLVDSSVRILREMWK